MAYSPTLKLQPTYGSAKEFVRVESQNGEVLYTDIGALGSPSITENVLRIRATRKTGPALKPHQQRKTHNISRSMTVNVADQLYTGSVNLTVTTPGGNVFDAATIRSMISELQCIISDLEGANATGGSASDVLSALYIRSVQTLEVE